jgi:hypothetical protein
MWSVRKGLVDAEGAGGEKRGGGKIIRRELFRNKEHCFK